MIQSGVEKERSEFDYHRFCNYAASEILGAEVQGEYLYIVQPNKISVYEYHGNCDQPQLCEELIHNSVILNYCINQHYICIHSPSLIQVRDRRHWENVVYTQPLPKAQKRKTLLILNQHELYISGIDNDRIQFDRVCIKSKALADVIDLGKFDHDFLELASRIKPIFIKKMGMLNDFYICIKNQSEITLGMLFVRNPNLKGAFQINKIQLDQATIHSIYHHTIHCITYPNQSPEYVLVVVQKDKQLYLNIFEILPREDYHSVNKDRAISTFEEILNQFAFLGKLNELPSKKDADHVPSNEIKSDGIESCNKQLMVEVKLQNLFDYQSSFICGNALWILSKDQICKLELINENSIENILQSRLTIQKIISKSQYQTKQSSKIGIGIYNQKLLYKQPTVSFILRFPRQPTQSIAEEIAECEDNADILQKQHFKESDSNQSNQNIKSQGRLEKGLQLNEKDIEQNNKSLEQSQKSLQGNQKALESNKKDVQLTQKKRQQNKKDVQQNQNKMQENEKDLEQDQNKLQGNEKDGQQSQKKLQENEKNDQQNQKDIKESDSDNDLLVNDIPLQIHKSINTEIQIVYEMVNYSSQTMIDERTSCEIGINTQEVIKTPAPSIIGYDEIQDLVVKYSSSLNVTCTKIKQNQFQKDKFDKQIFSIVDTMAKTMIQPFLEQKYISILTNKVKQLSTSISTILHQQIQNLNENMRKIELKQGNLRGKRIFQFANQVDHIKQTVTSVVDALKSNQINKIAFNQVILEEAKSLNLKVIGIEKSVNEIVTKNEKNEQEIHERVGEILELIKKLDKEKQNSSESESEMDQSDDEREGLEIEEARDGQRSTSQKEDQPFQGQAYHPGMESYRQQQNYPYAHQNSYQMKGPKPFQYPDSQGYYPRPEYPQPKLYHQQQPQFNYQMPPYLYPFPPSPPPPYQPYFPQHQMDPFSRPYPERIMEPPKVNVERSTLSKKNPKPTN